MTFELTAVNIPVLIMFVLAIIEVVRTWGVTTRPLSWVILALVVLQLLWLLGLIALPGSEVFQQTVIWLAIVDAALVPVSVALAYMAAGRFTKPIASAIGLLALLHLLIMTGIVPVTGIA